MWYLTYMVLMVFDLYIYIDIHLTRYIIIYFTFGNWCKRALCKLTSDDNIMGQYYIVQLHRKTQTVFGSPTTVYYTFIYIRYIIIVYGERHRTASHHNIM